mgnify:CR=1 FL=1
MSDPADVLRGRKTLQRLQAPGEVVSHQEGMQVLPELGMGAMVVPFNRGLFQSTVHALDLTLDSAVSPGELPLSFWRSRAVLVP